MAKERINNWKDGQWSFDKVVKDSDPFVLTITDCPTEREGVQWFVDNNLIGKAELAVIARRKFDRAEKLTWGEFTIRIKEKKASGLKSVENMSMEELAEFMERAKKAMAAKKKAAK